MNQNKMHITLQAFTSCKSLFYLSLSALIVFFMAISCATTRKQSPAATLKSAHPQAATRHFNDDKIEKRLRNIDQNMFAILNFSHCNLFDICVL